MSASHGGSEFVRITRPSKAVFQGQTKKVLEWSELRQERATEVLAQIDPQYPFWAQIVFLRADRARYTLELINLALQFAVLVEMRIKHSLGCHRPIEYSAQVQPMITTPGHGTLPMGHATQAYVAVHVLRALLSMDDTPLKKDKRLEQLERQAARISMNRIIAGVHFPVDALAGRLLGDALGRFFLARVGATAMTRRAGLPRSTPCPTNWYDGKQATEFDDFRPAMQALAGGPAATPIPAFYKALTPATVAVPASALLHEMWLSAAGEWQ